ncbi:MAG: hypothetical protein LBQ57_07585, partial [Spirochaetales bacterium]|nr:hypothetical protein [Spirochaetales bacterium]
IEGARSGRASGGTPEKPGFLRLSRKKCAIDDSKKVNADARLAGGQHFFPCKTLEALGVYKGYSPKSFWFSQKIEADSPAPPVAGMRPDSEP